MKIRYRLLRYALYLMLFGVVVGAGTLGVAYWLIAPTLPSVDTLKDDRLQVPLRVYSSDGKLMATYGEIRRIPVHIADVPEPLKNAFLAAEDADFYRHSGIDLSGLFRAVWLMVTTGSRHVPGGSTITQQVARNYFLSSEVTFTRKISEILLAFRIENALSKDEILELYLNKIFLGNRAYGVAAAAEFYYGKTLDQLTIPECAMLASLPKFPSTGNPLYNRPRALIRRDYVLRRMLDNGFITAADFEHGSKDPDLSYAHEPPIEVDAPYLTEMVRAQAIERLGNDALNDGYVVRTTIDSGKQESANDSLRSALLDYDRRHGYRGPEAHVDPATIEIPEQRDQILGAYRPISGLVAAVVTRVDTNAAMLYLSDGQSVSLDMQAVAWARSHVDESRRGSTPNTVADVLKPGDIVRLARAGEDGWQLSQLPVVQGALVGLDPADGGILALVGGFSFQRSKFNRVVQSSRSAGSSFKPFLYSAAFEHGFNPASIVNDAPLTFPDPSQPNGIWAPKNDDDKYDGPIRLREALVRSVNTVSVRLLDAIGMRYARTYILGRFGFNPSQLPENLSLALGTASVAPLNMARAYSVFANGGFLIDPYFIRDIADRDGKIVYQANPALACRDCPERLADGGAVKLSRSSDASTATADSTKPSPNLAPRTIDPRNDYLLTSMMRDVIRRGTGSAAMVLKRNDLAGKTGTTNDHRDAWFSGFNAKLVATAWVGFDDFSSLGRGEFGAKAALPIWIEFMRKSLHDVPEQPLDMPSGIVSVRIDRDSGTLASASDAGAMLEVMKKEDVAHLNEQAAQRENDPDAQREAYDVF